MPRKRQATHLANGTFQEMKPGPAIPGALMGKHPFRHGDTIRITPFKHGNNPGNPSKKTPPENYQLATKSQLQNKNNIILGADNQISTMGGIRHFYCQHPGHCYRIDKETEKEIYYTCVNGDCHEIRPNDKNGIYPYANVSGRITNNASDLMHAATPFIAIAHCVFQEENPHLLPIIMRPRTRRSPKKHGNNPGNRPQKTAGKHYQLATQSQLQNNTILGADNQTIAMETIPDFHCQENSPCYRLDKKTGEKIYYTCISYTHCHEIKLNYAREIYVYLDKKYNIHVSMANNQKLTYHQQRTVYIANGTFQKMEPDDTATLGPSIYKHPLRQGDTINITLFEKDHNPGNRPQKTAAKYYLLATQRQLQNNTILGADNQTIAMETIPDLHCQENSPCYRLDKKTGEKIYYICVDNDENSCREIRLNHQHAFYFYLDENDNMHVSMANNKKLTYHQ